ATPAHTVSLHDALPIYEVYCYLVNLKSGAWARRTGWDTRCLHVFNGLAYFGTNDGRIMLADTGGLDDGEPYEAFLANHFDHLDRSEEHTSELPSRENLE